jgi:CRISPR/Cas system-associated protein endoribonuclease Cas2
MPTTRTLVVQGREHVREGAEELKRVRDIDKARPRKGVVHVLAVTDRQFEQMTVFRGDKTAKHRNRPDELALF